MNYDKMDRRVSIAGGQILHEHLDEIGAMGFKGIICNRPDGEADDQPDFDDLEAHAERLGIPMFYIPYLNGALTPKLLAKLDAAIESIDGPVLMFCRSGRRSRILWNAVRGPQRMAAE